MGIEQAISAWAFALVSVRLGVMLVACPVLHALRLPWWARAVTALAAAIGIAPTQAGGLAVPGDAILAGLAVGREALIGGSIGMIAALPVLMFEKFGVLASIAAGLGVPRVSGTGVQEDDAITRCCVMLGLSVFVVLGGVSGLFAAGLASMERFPIGVAGAGGTWSMPLEVARGVLASGAEVCVIVALPALAGGAAGMVVLGLLARLMPSMSVMVTGGPAVLVAVLLTLAGSLWSGREALRSLAVGGLRALTGGGA
jgi:flagellar biosynthesis protein FliR